MTVGVDGRGLTVGVTAELAQRTATGPQDDDEEAAESPAADAATAPAEPGGEAARNPLKGLLGSEEGGALRRVMYDSNPHSLARYLASTEAKPIRKQVGPPAAPRHSPPLPRTPPSCGSGIPGSRSLPGVWSGSTRAKFSEVGE